MKLKTFERFAIVNFKDTLGGNLSADYHLNKQEGRNPYIKEDGFYVSLKTKSIPKNTEYLTDEQVEKFNTLAIQIKELQAQQEIIKDQQKSIIK
jgi:hypothetical protein